MITAKTHRRKNGFAPSSVRGDCGRIKAHAAQCAKQFVTTEHIVQREECRDAAARARAFRDRQYTVAEALLAAAGSYLAQADAADLERMNFADACKALDVTSRIGQQVATDTADDSSAPTRGLRDQLAALLDQACDESPPPPRPAFSDSAGEQVADAPPVRCYRLR